MKMKLRRYDVKQAADEEAAAAERAASAPASPKSPMGWAKLRGGSPESPKTPTPLSKLKTLTLFGKAATPEKEPVSPCGRRLEPTEFARSRVRNTP